GHEVNDPRLADLLGRLVLVQDDDAAVEVDGGPLQFGQFTGTTAGVAQERQDLTEIAAPSTRRTAKQRLELVVRDRPSRGAGTVVDDLEGVGADQTLMARPVEGPLDGADDVVERPVAPPLGVGVEPMGQVERSTLVDAAEAMCFGEALKDRAPLGEGAGL